LNILQSLLDIVGGWMALGRTEPANPILDEGRKELLAPPTSGKPLLLEVTRLVTAHIAAVGQGPACLASPNYSAKWPDPRSPTRSPPPRSTRDCT
jgi:hypothetical protein